MTKEKSLTKLALEAHRELFQEVGDFIEGSVIFDLWNLLPQKKEILLKGELNVKLENLRNPTHNIIVDSLELVSLANRFYLYWQFGEKNNVFLICKPKTAEGLEALSNLFTRIIELFEKQVIELLRHGVRLYNDFLFNDHKFLDIVECLEKNDKYFAPYNFTFNDSKQELQSKQLFGGHLDTDVLLGLLKKYARDQFFELMKFKKDYLKQFKKVVFDLHGYLGGLSQEEFDKTNREELFKQRLDKEGLIYP